MDIEEIKDAFAKEFYKTCDMIAESYPEHKEEKNAITGSVIISLLHSMQLDVEKLTFRAFVDKYIPYADYLKMNDYTYDECIEIIEKAKLSPTHRDIARMYVLERKNFYQIADSVLLDYRTVHKAWNNVISKELRSTGVRIRNKG